jgi:chaperonin GroES
MTDSGLLYIPDSAQEKPVEGIVLGTSKGRWDRSGLFIPTEVQEGDRVLFGRYSGSELTLRGESVRLMREEELLLVIVTEKGTVASDQ